MLFGFGQVLCVIRAKGKRGGRRWRRRRRGTEVDNNELQREKTRTTSRRVRTMTRTRGRKKGLTQYSYLKTQLQVPVGRHTIEVYSTLIQISGLTFAVVGSKTLAETGKLKLKACVTLKPRAKGNLIFGLGSRRFWKIGHWCRRIWDLIKGVVSNGLGLRRDSVHRSEASWVSR